MSDSCLRLIARYTLPCSSGLRGLSPGRFDVGSSFHEADLSASTGPEPQCEALVFELTHSVTIPEAYTELAANLERSEASFAFSPERAAMLLDILQDLPIEERFSHLLLVAARGKRRSAIYVPYPSGYAHMRLELSSPLYRLRVDGNYRFAVVA